MNKLNVAPPYSLVESRHGWMLANLNDVYMGAAIATYGEANELELALLLALAEYPGMVVEVGANMGIHTVPLARALQQKDRQLVAFRTAAYRIPATLRQPRTQWPDERDRLAVCLWGGARRRHLSSPRLPENGELRGSRHVELRPRCR